MAKVEKPREGKGRRGVQGELAESGFEKKKARSEMSREEGEEFQGRS